MLFSVSLKKIIIDVLLFTLSHLSSTYVQWDELWTQWGRRELSEQQTSKQGMLSTLISLMNAPIMLPCYLLDSAD